MIGALSQPFKQPLAQSLKSSFERIEPSGDAGFDRAGEAAAEIELTLPEKAAIIISSLAPEAAAQMLRSLSEEEVRRFARASSRLEEISREQLDAIIEEFLAELDKDGLAMTPDKLKRLLADVMSADAIERIFEDIDETEGRSLWDKLGQADVGELASFLSREHPQTVAVVISRIKPDRAAKVMMRFEPDFGNEVVMRMSKLSQLQPHVMDAIKGALEDEFLKNARQGRSKRRPDEVIGSILNFMSNDKRDGILNALEEDSPPLALAVQRKMFTFGHIPRRVDRANIAVVVREIENDVLVDALSAGKSSDPEVVRYFFDNMSRRMAEQIEEAIEDRPSPTAKEGEEAQFQVVDVVRRLADRGVFKLNMDTEDDEEGF